MDKKQLPLRGLRPLDSGGIYILAQITIVMFQVLLTLILGFFKNEQGLNIEGNMVVAYVLILLTNIAMIVTPLIYCRFTGVNFLRELDLKRGISVGQAGLLILIALASIVAFMPISNLFIEGIEALGYDYEMTVPSYVDNAGVLILSLFFVAIMPAIGEEVLYRGFLARGMRKFGIVLTFVLSALLFATAHGNLLQFVYQFFLGLVLVTVYFATRSIYASMIVHATNNGVALIINYIVFHTTGDVVIDTGLRGANLVFASIGVSILGMVVLCLLIWAFLVIAKKRQDKYVGDRTVNVDEMRVFGRRKKRTLDSEIKHKNNIFTRYFDFLKYLNYSFEEEELERTYKMQEEINYDNADKCDKEHYEELLRSRLEKDRRWDRTMVILALGYNIFVLIVNMINAFRGA